MSGNTGTQPVGIEALLFGVYVIISTSAEVRLGNLFQARPRSAAVTSLSVPAADSDTGSGTASAYQAPEVRALVPRRLPESRGKGPGEAAELALPVLR